MRTFYKRHEAPIAAAAMIFVIICLAIGWHGAWIAPNDAHLKAVAECAGSRSGDRKTWRACHNKLIGDAAPLVQTFSPPTR